jgi:hypothetical protein
MLPVVHHAPDRNRFGWKHAVGIDDSKYPIGLQNTIHLAEDFDRLGHVLNRHGHDYSVEGIVGKRQMGVGVEVVDDIVIQSRIVRHFRRVEAQPCQSLFRQIRGPVRAPTTHQIENDAMGWKRLTEKLFYSCDGAVINMDDFSRLCVKRRVRLVIEAREMCRLEKFFSHAFPTFRSSWLYHAISRPVPVMSPLRGDQRGH